jgi:hypothetical protein
LENEKSVFNIFSNFNQSNFRQEYDGQRFPKYLDDLQKEFILGRLYVIVKSLIFDYLNYSVILYLILQIKKYNI